MKLTIYWLPAALHGTERYNICLRFSIPVHITVNGETSCNIREEDLPLLREYEKNGYLQIRYKNN